MQIKSLIFDMDGVLWRDQTPLGDLKKLFEQIDVSGIKVAFATNNSSKTPQQYQKKLADFGVQVSADQVFTSGTTLASMILEKLPEGGPVFIIGEEGLVKILQNHGFYHQEKNVLAVAGGLDFAINYEKLKKASLLVQSGVPFFFTNIDPTFPTPHGNIPGAGSILAALETASGVKAITPGKPEPYMFLNALKWLKTSPEQTLVIGDRVDTDILGGIKANCKTALVLSGVTSEEDLKSHPIQPDFIFINIEQLITSFVKQSWKI